MLFLLGPPYPPFPLFLSSCLVSPSFLFPLSISFRSLAFSFCFFWSVHLSFYHVLVFLDVFILSFLNISLLVVSCFLFFSLSLSYSYPFPSFHVSFRSFKFILYIFLFFFSFLAYSFTYRRIRPPPLSFPSIFPFHRFSCLSSLSNTCFFPSSCSLEFSPFRFSSVFSCGDGVESDKARRGGSGTRPGI